jgi:hypothetical protein
MRLLALNRFSIAGPAQVRQATRRLREPSVGAQLRIQLNRLAVCGLRLIVRAPPVERVAQPLVRLGERSVLLASAPVQRLRRLHLASPFPDGAQVEQQRRTLGVKGDPLLADPYTVTVSDPKKVVVLTQTTLSVDDTMKTIEILKARFPKLIVPPSDDLCYATKNRQDAVKRISPEVDLFLVVTSDYSSNGMRLLELAHDLSGNARRIESAHDIEENWLEGVTSVGVTSAASTPDDLVQEIVLYFRARNPRLELIEEGQWENITFRKPKRVPAPL